MGSFLVILSAFGFSTLGVFGKMAYEAGFTRNQMLFWRFGLALPFLSLILFFNRAYPKKLAPFLKAVMLGSIGIGVEATLYFVTLEYLGAALTGIFLYLYPAFVALISILFLKEKLSLKKWLCILISLVGSVLTAGVMGEASPGTINPLEHPVGLFFGIMTALWYACYLLLGNRITQNQNPLTVSSGIVAGAFLSFLILTFFEVGKGVPFRVPQGNQAWIAIGGMTLIASVLPFTTLYSGMKRIGALATSLLSTLELVFTVILAAAFLGEKLTLFQGLGAGLILLSVLLVSLLRSE